jgi:hypothetical protein
MSTATETSVTVVFDPTAINKQADVIGAATPTRAGVMTAAQAADLARIVQLLGSRVPVDEQQNESHSTRLPPTKNGSDEPAAETDLND